MALRGAGPGSDRLRRNTNARRCWASIDARDVESQWQGSGPGSLLIGRFGLQDPHNPTRELVPFQNHENLRDDGYPGLWEAAEQRTAACDVSEGRQPCWEMPRAHGGWGIMSCQAVCADVREHVDMLSAG
jgi:hypothetical protein